MFYPNHISTIQEMLLFRQIFVLSVTHYGPFFEVLGHICLVPVEEVLRIAASKRRGRPEVTLELEFGDRGSLEVL